MTLMSDRWAGAPAPSRPDLSERLRAALLDGQVGEGEPGAVIAVYRDGALVASACAGVADVRGQDPDQGTSPGPAANNPLTADTLMNIASISKQMAAAAILIAARGGALDLDADLRGLVPELRVPGVTLRNCLNHTAGLPDYLAVAYTVGMPEIEIAALSVFLDWVTTLDGLEFAPGERQSYSNTGYVLAALALERAVGRPFPEVLAESVLVPLGMTKSFSTTVLGEFSAGMAFSFSQEAPGEFVKETMGVGEVEPVRGVNGDGEVITSLNEFGAWQAFLLDGRVLGEDIRSQLLARTTLTDGTETTYGFGIEHETKAETAGYVHSGGMWAFSAYSIVDEKSGLSVACFANRGGYSASEAAWKAMHLASGFGDIAGDWFATRSLMGARIEVLSAGDLAARTGMSEEPETATWRGGRVWEGNDDFARIEPRSRDLKITSWFGIAERYERLDPAGGHPGHLPGTYDERAFGRPFVFEERGAELWLVPPGREPERVKPFGQRGAEWIGETSLGWVIADGEAAGRVRVGLGTFAAELVRR